jgi:hypothetical protein
MAIAARIFSVKDLSFLPRFYIVLGTLHKRFPSIMSMGINFSADLRPCQDVTLECHASGADACLTIAAKDRPDRLPIHCIVVLDISGSMNSEASLPNPNANPDEAQVSTRHPPSPCSSLLRSVRIDARYRSYSVA